MTSEAVDNVDDAATLQLQVYAWARGGTTPPLLMNPEETWKVKTFTRVALSGLRYKAPGPMVATNARTGAVLDASTKLEDADLMRYDMVTFSPAET